MPSFFCFILNPPESSLPSGFSTLPFFLSPLRYCLYEWTGSWSLMYMPSFSLLFFSSLTNCIFSLLPQHTPIRHSQVFQNCHEILSENMFCFSFFIFSWMRLYLFVSFLIDSCLFSILRHSAQMTTIDDIGGIVEFDYFDIIIIFLCCLSGSFNKLYERRIT